MKTLEIELCFPVEIGPDERAECVLQLGAALTSHFLGEDEGAKFDIKSKASESLKNVVAKLKFDEETGGSGWWQGVFITISREGRKFLAGNYDLEIKSAIAGGDARAFA